MYCLHHGMSYSIIDGLVLRFFKLFLSYEPVRGADGRTDRQTGKTRIGRPHNNFFTVTFIGKLLKPGIPPHRKFVTTLPCEI